MTRRKVVVVSAGIVVLLIVTFYAGVLYGGSRRSGDGHTGVIEKPANVKSIQMGVLESFPVQVNVVAYGEFPDSCTEINKVATTRKGDTFVVTLTTRRPADVACAQVITLFEEVIHLDVVGLKKGTYVVDVNGVRGTFELEADNILQTTGLTTAEEGFLEGKVVIGPLCPVEPCTLSQDQIERAYEARKIMIYSLDRSSIIAAIPLDQKGEYRIALIPGRYLVDINRIGIDSSQDVPREITIETGKTVRLDVQIDTGIR